MPLIFVPSREDSELRLDWRELVAILQDMRDGLRWAGSLAESSAREEEFQSLAEMAHDALVIAHRVGRTLMLDARD